MTTTDNTIDPMDYRGASKRDVYAAWGVLATLFLVVALVG